MDPCRCGRSRSSICWRIGQQTNRPIRWLASLRADDGLDLPKEIDSLAISEDGRMLAIASGPELAIFHVGNLEPVRTIVMEGEWRALALTAQHDMVMSCSLAGEAIYWSPCTGQIISQVCDGLPLTNYCASGA